MIRQEIDVNVNDATMNGEITVPSPVIAITSQEETYDLTERKNFSIKLKDTDGFIVLEDGSSYINVDFKFGGKIYNANMSIYKRSINGDVTLQYASGLTAKDAPEPETHTLEFNSTDFYCSYDKYTKSSQETGQLYIYYDGNAVHPTYNTLRSTTHAAVTIYTDGYAKYRAKTNIEVGDYVDELTFTYEGLTATCSIHVSVTDSEPTLDK